MKTYKECDIPVVILGTEYTLHICPESKDKRFETLNCDGFCDRSTKELWVSNYLDSDKQVSVANPRYCILHAIKHEMEHAYLYESGLGSDWEHKEFGHEETTVDWIASQFEKIHFIYNEILQKLTEFEIGTEDVSNETKET